MTRDTREPRDCKAVTPERSSKSLLDKWTFINRINGDPELQPTTKLVASYLMWRMNCRYETCFPSRETIAADLGLSIRTVHDGVKALKDRGWLMWQRRHENSSVYRFLWGRADDDRESYVARDQAPQQEPETANSAISQTAKSDTLTTGKDLTQEDPSLLSTASPTRASPRSSETNPTSAETKPNPNPKHSPQWWDWKLWYETAPRFKAMFYPTISKSAFGKRLGEIKRRQANDIRAVDQALLDAIKAEPGGDAWEYVCGILRGANTPRNRPIDELDPEFRPRAPIDRFIM